MGDLTHTEKMWAYHVEQARQHRIRSTTLQYGIFFIYGSLVLYFLYLSLNGGVI